MSAAPEAARQPLIFEANARLLLRRLSRRERRELTLGSVPPDFWRDLGSRFQWLWLMGVWERSPASREQALTDPRLRRAYTATLPDWTADDVGGSPYAVRRYRLDPALGRDGELAILRKRLAGAGLGLILDFVPNHVARDHPWTAARPEYFVRPSNEALARHPGWFFRTAAGAVLAHGRDPHFPPWTDTAQLDFSSRDLRQALTAELLSIARLCDGVRCDMAMLALNDVHAETWGAVRVSWPSAGEFWAEAIARVRREHPGFLFIAEAYWELEPRLVELGFDYVYDKGLYDALRREVSAVRDHLASDPLEAQALHFIENHDEPRAATTFGREQALAAATIAATLPGAFLVHDGQLEGRRAHLPVQLLREPDEQPDSGMEAAYEDLLRAVNAYPIGTGTWQRLEVDARDAHGPDALLAWRWDEEHRACLVVVNYSAAPARGRIVLDTAQVTSALADRQALPAGSTVQAGETLEVTLEPWQARILDMPKSDGR